MRLSTLMIELLGLLVVTMVAWGASTFGWRPWRRASRAFSQLGRRHRVAIVATGLVSFAISGALFLQQMPVPAIHDEFSYLLAADTFAHGRLTNPTHPMWEHFESFHIIQQPTYCSKYPPASGLIMALGKVLCGHEIVGVWLAAALAAAAASWMLQAWLPGRWALFGGLLVAFHPVQLLWSQSYWGGSVALLGGFLLFGGFGHWRRTPSRRNAGWMACGIVVLLNSRPFEGLMATLVTGTAMLIWYYRHRSEFGVAPLGRTLTTVLAVLIPVAGWMAYYNYRTTGNALRMPYQVHEATYGISPLFLWQPPRENVQYRHPVMESFNQGWALDWYRSQHTLAGWARTKLLTAATFWWVFLRLVWTVPCLALPRVLRKAENRRLIIMLFAATAPSTLVPWLQPHYVAPVLPLLFLLVVQCLRHVRAGAGCGRVFGPVFVGGLLLVSAVTCGAEALVWQAAPDLAWARDRACIMQRLREESGQHLVVVRYSIDHDSLHEWVYNEADIDASRVVWAREMSPAENARLGEYFPTRRVWLLEADASPPVLIEHRP